MKLFIAGDFCPNNDVEQYTLSSDNPEELIGGLLPFIKRADIGIVNLECPLTMFSGEIQKCGIRMKAIPETIEILVKSGINLVTLANNHICDYGRKGLEDTLDVCRRAGIDTVLCSTYNLKAKM